MLTKLRLFFSSYAPLFAIMAIRVDDEALRVVFVVLALLGVLTAVLIAKAVGGLEAEPFQVANVRDRGPEVAGYVATYLLPFLTVPDPSARDLIAYMAFLVLVAIVYVNSEMVAINPLLYLFGYKLMSMETVTGFKALLVTRAVPSPGEKITARRLSSVLVAAKRKREDQLDGG